MPHIWLSRTLYQQEADLTSSFLALWHSFGKGRGSLETHHLPHGCTCCMPFLLTGKQHDTRTWLMNKITLSRCLLRRLPNNSKVSASLQTEAKRKINTCLSNWQNASLILFLFVFLLFWMERFSMAYVYGKPQTESSWVSQKHENVRFSTFVTLLGG